MRSIRALRSRVALGFDVGGERFTYATTPYNDLVSAATGLTDSNVEGTRQTQALFFELDMPMTRKLDVDVSDREDRYSDFGRTNNGKLTVTYKAVEMPHVAGIRLHRLPGAHAVQLVLAQLPGGLEQRHHGNRQPGLRGNSQGTVHRGNLQHAGTGFVRRQQEPDARNLAKLQFRCHSSALGGSECHAGLLPGAREEHHWRHSGAGHLWQSVALCEPVCVEQRGWTHSVDPGGRELPSLSRQRPAATSCRSRRTRDGSRPTDST